MCLNRGGPAGNAYPGDAAYATARAPSVSESAGSPGPVINGWQWFSDAPEDEYTYEGDGAATVAWFRENSNFEALIQSMDADTLEAFNAWTGGDFMNKDQWLPWNQRSAQTQQRTRLMDQILDQAVVTKPLVIHRLGSARLLGLNTRKVTSMSQLTALAGTTITADGFNSSAAAAEGLPVGIEDYKNVEYRFRIPGGSRGACMWIGDSRLSGGWGARQREVIVNRDTAWTVGQTTYDRHRDVYVVEMTYAGRNEHDYGQER